jgi:ribosomal protein S18 acetylase RimI-like enzyme
VDFRPSQSAGDDAPRPYLSDLCVCPSRRRQGIGAALVRACEATVKARRPNRGPAGAKLFLKAERDNMPAMAMYEELGYKVELVFDDGKALLSKTIVEPAPVAETSGLVFT